MLTMIFGSFGFGRRAWKPPIASKISPRSMLSSRCYVSCFGSAPRQGDRSLRPQTIAFKGAAQSLTFVVDLRGTTTTVRLHEVRLGSRAPRQGNPRDGSLPPSRSTGQDLPLLPIVRTKHPRRDSSPMESGRLRCVTLGAAKLGDRTPNGTNRWADGETPPQLIEVAVNLEADDPRRWPLLLVRPELR